MIIYEEILKEFHRQKVRYVLVGGIAFNLLGGYRNTFDIDILVQMTDSNLRKIVNILKKAGYRVKQPVDPLLIADKSTREDWIKNKHMKSFNFYKNERSYEEVDIIIDSPINFKQAIKSAKKIKVGKLNITVISPKNLIKMKKVTGRNKDLRDIKELKLISKIT
jgi:hypothetical protein